jgi:hypothetical protein
LNQFSIPASIDLSTRPSVAHLTFLSVLAASPS